jgi:4-hydroxyphenylacetate 3-hydroxylase N terminal
MRGQGGAQGNEDIEAARVRELVRRDLVDEQDLVVIPGFSRTSYEQMATSPFDFPLSSRFDENDAVAVFDDVLVALENVLVYRNVEKAMGFYSMRVRFVQPVPAEGRPPASRSK